MIKFISRENNRVYAQELIQLTTEMSGHERVTK